MLKFKDLNQTKLGYPHLVFCRSRNQLILDPIADNWVSYNQLNGICGNCDIHNFELPMDEVGDMEVLYINGCDDLNIYLFDPDQKMTNLIISHKRRR